jgi:signal transduction histidine kinase
MQVQNESKNLLDDFEKETRGLTIARIKTASVLVIAIFPLFGVLDYFIYPENFRFFMLLRLMNSLAYLGILILCFTKFAEYYLYPLGVVTGLTVSLFISWIILYTGGHASMYYAGMNLVIMGFGFLMPWDLRRAFVVYAFIYLFYLIPILNLEKISMNAIFLNNNFFLLSTIAIAATASYVGHKLRFREFMSRYELKVANSSLEEAKTNLERAYRKLKELDAIKTQFFSNISHELRTPLTLVLAPLESMMKGEMGVLPVAQRSHMEIMYQNSLRLLKMINNLLDLAKIDAGKMNLVLDQVNLPEFIKGIVASVSPLAEKKQIRLSFKDGDQLPEVVCDKEKIERVLLNLIFNSLKFTEPGGTVTVRCGNARSLETDGQGNRVMMSVSDTGIGFPKEYSTRIFERFSQVDASASRKHEGTGIGLALAKELVELHHGRIWADSEPGKGTVMTFTLPMDLKLSDMEGTAEDRRAERRRARERRESEGRRAEDWTKALHTAAEYSATDILKEGVDVPAPAPAESEAPEHTVLLIEDNADMRRFIAFQLQDEFKLLQARDGIEGVGLATQHHPDIIISDVMMPGKDGYQVCREIKTDPHTKHIPVILLTAKAELSEKISGLEYGADDYLTKPFNAQELKAKIRSLVQLRRLEREIQHRSEELERTLKMLQDTQTQLVHSEKMAALGLLVAGIAHEVNNPVSFAKGSLSNLRRYLGQVREALEKQPETRQVLVQFNKLLQDIEQSLNIVKAGLERTEGIVTDLKTFARKDEQHTKRVDVQDGLEATIKLIQHEMADRITLHRDYGIREPAEIIPGQINQVFMNLLQNAIHAIPEKGDIWIRTWEDGEWVHISVRDSGKGIRKEHLGRIFEPFFTTKEVGQGTGLGLSVSYRIIENHGGKITVSSEEGKGAEFVITLPKRQLPDRPAKGISPEPVSAKGNAR